MHCSGARIQPVDVFCIPDKKLAMPIDGFDHRRSVSGFPRVERLPLLLTRSTIKCHHRTSLSSYRANKQVTTYDRMPGGAP